MCRFGLLPVAYVRTWGSMADVVRAWAWWSMLELPSWSSPLEPPRTRLGDVFQANAYHWLWVGADDDGALWRCYTFLGGIIMHGTSSIVAYFMVSPGENPKSLEWAVTVSTSLSSSRRRFGVHDYPQEFWRLHVFATLASTKESGAAAQYGGGSRCGSLGRVAELAPKWWLVCGHGLFLSIFLFF
jgi:hypothetical protein